MTRRDDIEKALDAALETTFPPHDVGYPETPHTRRTRAIMETAIAMAGVPVSVYNFHEVGGVVNFNRSYPTPDGGTIIGAWAISVNLLDTLSDAAIIQRYAPIFEDYEGKNRPLTLECAEDD